MNRKDDMTDHKKCRDTEDVIFFEEAAMKTATEAHAEIQRLATEKAVPEVRFIDRIDIGKVVRQGDVYVHAVAENHPKGKEAKSRQLAIGTTQGSRHVAEAPSSVYEGTAAPEWCGQTTFVGPRIVSQERFTITHPEHAQVSLPPGHYQVTHQLDAKTLQRVQD